MKNIKTALFCLFSVLFNIHHAFASKSPSHEDVTPITEKYIALVQASYQNVLDDARNLQKAIRAFIQAPSLETQNAAKDAWKKARDSYSPTEAFRFYGGPIDMPEQGVEALLNAWPIDESYIDYVQGHAEAGLINAKAKYPKLNKAALAEAHEKEGERNVSVGYHAIEFLLWGQDLDLKSAGKRSFEDYVPSKNPTATRRGEYLQTTADLLVEHAEYLVNSWKSNQPYPASLKNEKPDELVRRFLTGVTSLAADEMAGERMTVSMEKNDQENEQNCFSDYTLNDLISNQKGIMAVYNETGFMNLFEKTDAKLAKKIKQQLETSLKLLSEIPAPFDLMVSEKKMTPAKKKANLAIASLQKQAELTGAMAKKMGVHLNVQ